MDENKEYWKSQMEYYQERAIEEYDNPGLCEYYTLKAKIEKALIAENVEESIKLHYELEIVKKLLKKLDLC